MKQMMSLEDELYRHFKYESFQVGQKEIIKDVLKGENVLGVLPTGSGKSLCYQLPAKLLQGTTLVVSPLISLMVDQVKELRAHQYKGAIAINSFMDWQERQYALSHLHTYDLIYLSPELLNDKAVLGRLKKIKISLFVIDEAHCISQWGHEFRTDYLRLPTIINSLQNPPVLAISATAQTDVQQDIITILQLKDVKTHIYPIDRPNISLVVEELADDEEKQDYIVSLLERYRVPTVIYFLSRKKCEELSALLSAKLIDKEIAFYHAGMDSFDRLTVQQQFMNDNIDIICSTSAFGMGINKENIRLVIHYHMPVELESFIQEIGRAGRDGKASVSVSFQVDSDYHLPLNIIEQQLPTEADISLFFNKLYDLYENQEKFPRHDELATYFGLTDTQIRFLSYQLEKYGIIKHKTIVYDEAGWKRAQALIIAFKNERLLYKQGNLNNLHDWQKTGHCLRERLYLPFQNSYTEIKEQCCSNCHFDFNKWQPDDVIKRKDGNLSWQEKLAQVFLVGEQDDPRRIN